jgi:hypothetical protein
LLENVESILAQSEADVIPLGPTPLGQLIEVLASGQ